MKDTTCLFVHHDRSLWELDIEDIKGAHKHPVRPIKRLPDAYKGTLDPMVRQVIDKFTPPFIIMFSRDRSFIMNVPVSDIDRFDLSGLNETDKQLFASCK